MSAAKEEISTHWNINPGSLEVIGEPNLLHFLSLNGFLSQSTHLVTSSIDVGKIRAVARAHAGAKTTLNVSPNGQIESVNLVSDLALDDVLFSLQLTNGETGISQDLRPWSHAINSIIADATHALPEGHSYRDFKALTLDATSWNGPSGIGFLVVNDSAKFRYPLPHIAPIRVPGSFSLPLLIGSAIALSQIMEERSHCYDLRNQLRNHLAAIDGLEVIGGDSDSRYLSIIVTGISSEELLRSLLKRDIAIDAGSACSPDDLTPSHVIDALGFPTTGHLRFTIHPTHTAAEITNLIKALREELLLLNR